MKKRNAGFSLIELVLTMAIFMIASLSIYQFVVIASKHYQKETIEVNLQYEAQLSMNQLNDLLIDTTKGVSYRVNGGTKELFLYNEGKYYVITWDATSQSLLYSEYVQNADSSWTQKTNKVLMAEYVEEFEVDLSDLEQSQIVRLSVKFRNSREYQVTQNVTLRNKVAVNAEISELY